MAFGDYMQIDIVFFETASQNKQRCRLYYSKGAGPEPVPGDIGEFANDFKTAFTAATPATLPTTVTLYQVEAVWRTGANTYIDGSSNTGQVAGTVSGDMLPEECAVVFQRRTGLAGRNKRGRVFWPYIPESFTAGSSLSSNSENPYAAVADMLKSDVNAGPEGTTFQAMQPDWKTAQLHAVQQVRWLSEVCSRRDRRYVKRPIILTG